MIEDVCIIGSLHRIMIEDIAATRQASFKYSETQTQQQHHMHEVRVKLAFTNSSLASFMLITSTN